MKKTLALALVLVMVISSVCVIFASAELPEAESPFYVVAFDDGSKEGAGAIFTEEDTAGAWWIHVALKPVEGAADTYEVVEISDGIEGGGAVALDIPEGGFVYGVNTGNNYPALLEKDPSKTEYKDKPNYTSTACNDMIAQARKWAVGDQITIKGVDIANKVVPTSTPDKEWYEDGYVCTATYAKYDPNAATTDGSSEEPSEETSGEPSEETSPAEPVEVTEEIAVDGKLDDTGWVKAEWKTVNTETGTQQVQPKEDADKVAIGDLEYQFAVRTNDENVYVAVKVNALPHNCSVADTMDAKVSSGTHLRIYVTPDEDIAAYGKDGAMAVLDTLLDILVENDGTLGVYKSKELTEEVEAVLTTTETDSVYEFSFKKSLFNIGESFRMATSYSDNHFGTEGNGYNVLNDHKYDVASEGGVDTPWATNAHYTTYKVAELALGTYTEEPAPEQPGEEQPGEEKPDPAKELEEELKANVTAVEDADFTVDLASTLDKNEDGKLVYTVTLKVKPLKDEVKMQSFLGKLHFDSKTLKLMNGKVEDEEGDMTLDIVEKKPTSTWQNLSSLVTGEETSEVDLQFNTTNAKHFITADATLELTFTFEVLTDATCAGVYVDSESMESMYIPPATADFIPSDKDTVYYKGQGAYTLASYVEPAPVEPDESSSEPSDVESSSSSAASTSSTPSKPGDAGILIFAVLGIVAIAGAVTVIKVRR